MSFLMIPILVVYMAFYSQGLRVHFRMNEMLLESRFRAHPAILPEEEDFVLLFMGGSSTEAAPFDTDNPYDYPTQLEVMLQGRGYKVRTFNAGIAAMDSRDALEFAPRLIQLLKPNIVFFSYYHNDQKYGFPSYERHRQVLEALTRFCTSQGAIPVFIIEVGYEWVNGEFSSRPETDQEGLERYTFPTVETWDPLSFFRKHRNALLFFDRKTHLNRFGYHLMSIFLYEKLLEKGLLPASRLSTSPDLP